MRLWTQEHIGALPVNFYSDYLLASLRFSLVESREYSTGKPALKSRYRQILGGTIVSMGSTMLSFSSWAWRTLERFVKQKWWICWGSSFKQLVTLPYVFEYSPNLVLPRFNSDKSNLGGSHYWWCLCVKFLQAAINCTCPRPVSVMPGPQPAGLWNLAFLALLSRLHLIQPYCLSYKVWRWRLIGHELISDTLSSSHNGAQASTWTDWQGRARHYTWIAWAISRKGTIGSGNCFWFMTAVQLCGVDDNAEKLEKGWLKSKQNHPLIVSLCRLGLQEALIKPLKLSKYAGRRICSVWTAVQGVEYYRRLRQAVGILIRAMVGMFWNFAQCDLGHILPLTEVHRIRNGLT